MGEIASMLSLFLRRSDNKLRSSLGLGNSHPKLQHSKETFIVKTVYFWHLLNLSKFFLKTNSNRLKNSTALCNIVMFKLLTVPIIIALQIDSN